MAAIETIYREAGAHTVERGESIREARASLTSMLSWLDGQFEKRRSRRALLEMSDDQLKDIGLSHADVHFEANRPFWR